MKYFWVNNHKQKFKLICFGILLSMAFFIEKIRIGLSSNTETKDKCDFTGFGHWFLGGIGHCVSYRRVSKPDFGFLSDHIVN